MPTYDYRCDANGCMVEINHRMEEQVANLGELCNKAGITPGDTPPETPVIRMATGGNLIKSLGIKANYAPTCPPGGCCANGMCGLN